ncbi:hypothetical protein ACKAV7_009739 [Fusarium commune]
MAEEDIRNHRTRCFGHILNLAARAFLWGEDPDSFEREAFTEAAFQVEERELWLWRKRGAVGKLHNIVRFVRASPQRRELMKSLACDQNDEDGYQLFEEERAAIDLELMQNNETRWNLTFLMIQRAIRKREHIDHFIAYLETKTSEPRQRVPVQDQLSPQDWLLLAEIQSLLKPLHEITMRCQGWAKEGRHGTLWEVMIGMEYLLNFFEEQNLIFSSPDSCISELRNFRVSATKRSSAQRIEQGRGREKHLPQHAREEYIDVVLQDENLDDDHRRCVQTSIKNCWSKLDEYCSLLGQSPLYPAAVILQPRWNVSWLEANWISDEQLVWLRDAKNSVRDSLNSTIHSCDRCMMEEDELGVYMRQGPVRRENLNPVLWWKDHQEEYPRLSKFALDILAIPAMSIDPERTFSVTKLTVSTFISSISIQFKLISAGLESAYLELLVHAYIAGRNGLARDGVWRWHAVIAYLKQVSKMEEQLAGGLYTACGQTPRISELLSLEYENGPNTSCGIYVWGGYMAYVVRHHKAKRLTNREFYVVRFLPVRLGHVLFKYLVYIRRVADLLRREQLGADRSVQQCLQTRLLFQNNGWPWPTSRLTDVAKTTLELWRQRINVRTYRQLAIAITEKHVREVYTPFNRHDDCSEDAGINVVLAWQSGHRPLQRGITYGFDGAYPFRLQPLLLRCYEGASKEAKISKMKSHLQYAAGPHPMPYMPETDIPHALMEFFMCLMSIGF